MEVKIVIFSIILCAKLCCSQFHSNQCWPFVKNVATSRASPINVNTFTAKPITVTPLVLIKVFNETAKIVNTGNALEVRSTQNSQNGLKGGVFYNETYIYHGSRFFWSDNGTGIVEHSINGVGATFAVEIIYYNKKYGNFNNSLNHYDGVAILSLSVYTDSIANPRYDYFQQQLLQVIQPGSEHNVNLGCVFTWYDAFAHVTGNYYAYPGSYTDVDSGRIYNCATVLVFPLTTAKPFISREQFARSFRLLKNKAWKPLTYSVTRYPVAGRPVVSASGIQNINLPYDVFK